MGLLSALGALLVALGVLDIFVHFTSAVGWLPMIIVGVILFIVGSYTGGGGWWRHGPPAP